MSPPPETEKPENDDLARLEARLEQVLVSQTRMLADQHSLAATVDQMRAALDGLGAIGGARHDEVAASLQAATRRSQSLLGDLAHLASEAERRGQELQATVDAISNANHEYGREIERQVSEAERHRLELRATVDSISSANRERGIEIKRQVVDSNQAAVEAAQAVSRVAREIAGEHTQQLRRLESEVFAMRQRLGSAQPPPAKATRDVAPPSRNPGTGSIGRKARKLLTNPNQFFADAENPLVRDGLGRLYRTVAGHSGTGTRRDD